MAFYIVLFFAGGNDVIAAHFDLSVNTVTYVFRALLFVLPIVSGFLTYRLCKELSARDRSRPEQLAVLTRTAEGGYVDDAEELSPSP
jgi:ubiquinol-cytochrome c reductase cytochrome b subunit